MWTTWPLYINAILEANSSRFSRKVPESDYFKSSHSAVRIDLFPGTASSWQPVSRKTCRSVDPGLECRRTLLRRRRNRNRFLKEFRFRAPLTRPTHQ